MKTFFAKLVAKYFAKKLDLQEGPMDGTKKWYKSTAVWAGVYAVLRGLYVSIQTNLAPQIGFTLPDVPPIIDGVFSAIIGGVGVHGRVTATEKIG